MKGAFNLGSCILLVVCIGLYGCQSSHPARISSPTAKPPASEWTITCSDPAATESAYLSNGQFGIRLGRDGSVQELLPPSSPNDSVQSSSPLPILTWPFDHHFDPRKVEEYSQTLDLQTGAMRTEWKEHLARGQSVRYFAQTIASDHGWSIAQKWQVEAPPDYLNIDSLYNPRSEIHFASPFTTLYQKSSAKELLFPGSQFAPAQFTLPVLFSIKRTSKPPEPIVSSHPLNDWRTDISIDGPTEDQQAIHSWMFYLWSSVPDNADTPVAPMGLSSTLYMGHQFWDADIWMFPALALTAPEKARTIANYRLRARPTFTNPPLTGYAWESSARGEELAPPEFQKAIHITGDVAFMLHQATELGLAPEDEADTIGRYAATYYSFHSQESRSIGYPNAPANQREILAVLGPDEYHVSDNDLYTNALAQWLEDRFDNGRLKYKFPKDEQGLISYDNDPIRNYGQADAALAIYPLQNQEAEKEANQIMTRIAPKTNPSSPAMTDSVHALILARLGKTDEAYQLWRHSWQDFSNHPLMLFSEERNKDRTYFLTGAAGCLQTVLYGFLGFRIDSKKDPQALWAKRLRGGDWLTLNPHLPKQWNKVTFRNFPLLGQRYTLIATHSGVTVTQGENP